MRTHTRGDFPCRTTSAPPQYVYGALGEAPHFPHSPHPVFFCLYRGSAAMAATFLRPAAEGESAEPAGSSGRAAAAGSSRTSRAFKLGNMQLKKLKNGDVYRVSEGRGGPCSPGVTRGPWGEEGRADMEWGEGREGGRGGCTTLYTCS